MRIEVAPAYRIVMFTKLYIKYLVECEAHGKCKANVAIFIVMNRTKFLLSRS